MLITSEQAKNGYPYQEIRFINTFSSYLSHEKDSYGLPLMKKDSFRDFDKEKNGLSLKLEEQYYQSIKAIHDYIDRGNAI